MKRRKRKRTKRKREGERLIHSTVDERQVNNVRIVTKVNHHNFDHFLREGSKYSSDERIEEEDTHMQPVERKQEKEQEERMRRKKKKKRVGLQLRMTRWGSAYWQRKRMSRQRQRSASKDSKLVASLLDHLLLHRHPLPFSCRASYFSFCSCSSLSSFWNESGKMR